MDPVTLSNLSFWMNLALIGLISGFLTRDIFDDSKRILAAFVLFTFLVVAPISWARNKVEDALTQPREAVSAIETTSSAEGMEIVNRIPLAAINEIPITPTGITFRQ